jgi:hypothetical protein
MSAPEAKAAIINNGRHIAEGPTTDLNIVKG